MKNLIALEKYFPKTGNTESDKEILVQAYILSDEFNKILKVPQGMPRIIVGKKGSGKSAIVQYIDKKFSSQKIPILSIRPSDIEIDFDDDNSISHLIRKSRSALIKAIANQLGSETATKKGILNGHEAVLNQLAVASGTIEEDKGQKVFAILNEIGKAVSDIDFSKLAKEFYGQQEPLIKRAIQGSLDEKSKIFYLSIDDTDQIASLSDSIHLNRIWAFILAARDIMIDMPNVKCFITLRTEIWKRLQKEGRSQRDQIDHVRGAVYELIPTDSNIDKIVKKRLQLACEDLKLNCSNKPFQPFFEKDFVTLPNSNNKKRYWDEYFSKRSRNPRDAIQLIGWLIEVALDHEKDKINDDHVNEIIIAFSKQRVDDLKVEVEDECPQIEHIIQAFSSFDFEQGFSMNTDKLKTFLETLPSRFSIYLLGRSIQSGSEEDVFRLWNYLLQINFLGARISDNTQRDNFTHIDDSSLEVVKANWNSLQQVIWEIHPSYRDYLINEIERKRKMTGLAFKKKK